MALVALVALIAEHRRAREAEERDALSLPIAGKAVPKLELIPLDSAVPEPTSDASVEGGPENLTHRSAARPKLPSVPLRPTDDILSNDSQLSAARVAATIAGARDRFAACNPEGERGRVLVELRISQDGSVASATAVESDPSPRVTECVLSTCRALRFPPHDGPDQVVRVPITFAGAAATPAPRPGTQLPDGSWVKPAWAIPDGQPVQRAPIHGDPP